MVIEYISFALGVTHCPFRPASVGIENPAGAGFSDLIHCNARTSSLRSRTRKRAYSSVACFIAAGRPSALANRLDRYRTI